MTLLPRCPRRPLRSAMVALSAVAVLGAGAACGTAPDASSPPSPAARTAAAGAGDAPVAAVPEGLVPVPVTVPAGLDAAPLDVPREALLPPGWTMSVLARVPGARLEAWAPDGTLLVSRPGSGDVVRLLPDGRGGAITTTLVAGLTQPHGLAFDGATLYVAESDAVNAYTYRDGVLADRRLVATGLPDEKSPDLRGTYAHALKSVAIGPDGAVYVSVGSTANVSPQDRGATPERAAILRIPPGGGAPQTFARGVRNGTGLAVAPDGALWTAVNNRDQLAYPFDRSFAGDAGSSYGKVIPDYVDDHPSEELARLTPGRDLGYPFCNPDPDPGTTQPGTTPASVATPPFTRDVQTNADGSRLNCDALPRIEMTMGAHSAPLGLSFATLPAPFGAGALVGIHGSWNRQPPRAPEVSFFPSVNGTLGPQRTLVGGFQAPDGSRWGRPVAAVTGPDGAVYVTDDAADAVYRVAPPGR